MDCNPDSLDNIHFELHLMLPCPIQKIFERCIVSIKIEYVRYLQGYLFVESGQEDKAFVFPAK